MFSDITKLKEAEDQLQQLAFYDPLTGLPNRRLFKESMEEQLSGMGDRSKKAALLFLDLDRFKFVNDSLGHLAGDQLLIQVSRRIAKEIRTRDIVSRQGGDEFAIALFDLEDESRISDVATRIINALNRSFTIRRQEVYIGASIGICVLPDQASSFEDAVRKADISMYSAKAAGKARFCFWDREAQEKIEAQIVLEAELRDAIRQDQLVLHYQPIVDCLSREIVSFEVLLRWQHPTRGLAFPDNFIPVAEEVGLITEVENWVIDNTCRQLSKWRRSGVSTVPVAINISAQHLGDILMPRRVLNALNRHNVPPKMLSIEVTESTAMQDTQVTIDTLRELKVLGVHSTIDDFGTGYSSLSYLKQLPADTLKIDRSFVKDLIIDSDDQDIAKAIVSLGHSLSMRTVAEGVENQEQLDILQDMGCDLIQGWFFYRAMPAAEAIQCLTDNAGTPARFDGLLDIRAESVD